MPVGTQLRRLKVGDAFGRYALLGRIAEGGMAEVWLSRQQGPSGFSKTVILKTISEQWAESPEYAERFLQEARLAALINHPNVVQTLDFGEEGGRRYIAMELLEGRTLYEVTTSCPQQRLPPEISARIIADCAAGLHHAHELKDGSGQRLSLVHRDVSPENILLTYSGQVKVLDFGIATARTLGDRTDPGILIGKMNFMAPEQIENEGLDRRVDIWALGVNLYLLLAGKHPFEGHSAAEVASSILTQNPPSPRAVNPSVPPELERIVFRALEKKPEHRYSNAADLRADLESFLSSRPPTTAYQLVSLMETLFPAEKDAVRQKLEYMSATSHSAALTELISAGRLGTTFISSTRAFTLPQTPLRASPPPSTAAKRRFLIGTAVAILSLVTLAMATRVLRTPEPLPMSSRESISVAVAPSPPAPTTEVAVPTAAAPPVEKKVERRKTPLARSRGSGKLAIRTTPWAEVWLDGVRIGETPLPAVAVTEGMHELLLVNAELGLRHQRRIQVANGAVHQLAIDLREAKGR